MVWSLYKHQGFFRPYVYMYIQYIWLSCRVQAIGSLFTIFGRIFTCCFVFEHRRLSRLMLKYWFFPHAYTQPFRFTYKLHYTFIEQLKVCKPWNNLCIYMYMHIIYLYSLHLRGGRMDKTFGLSAGRSGKCIAVDATVKYPLFYYFSYSLLYFFLLKSDMKTTHRKAISHACIHLRNFLYMNNIYFRIREGFSFCVFFQIQQ